MNEQFELTKSKLSEIESSNLKLVAQTQNLEEEMEKLLFEKSLTTEHSKLNNIVNIPLLEKQKNTPVSK
jgi:cell division protein FtsL